MPSYSTFRRSFLVVSPQGWVECFNPWTGSTLPPLVSLGLSVDGKSIRCTSTGGNTDAQNFVTLVAVYEQSLDVVRLAMMQNRKASEIHVAPAVLVPLPETPVQQCFSLDALHTTQATVHTISLEYRKILFGFGVMAAICQHLSPY